MHCSTCQLGASVAPHPAVDSVRVSASSSVGTVGSNVLWPSRLPTKGRLVLMEEVSFLANGGTAIAMGQSSKTFPAHPSFFQMSRHDISHLLSVVVNESAKSPEAREPAPRYFDATIEGEVSADFVDGLMESVMEYRESGSDRLMRGALEWSWRPVGAAEHHALTQLFGRQLPMGFIFVPPVLTLTMTPQNLAAYTVWDTICDNLKLSLHLLPSYVADWTTVEDFHMYAEWDLPSDIELLAKHGGESAVLAGLRNFVKDHSQGPELNYLAMFRAAETAIAAWSGFFSEGSLAGSLETGYFFARGSRFDTAYYMSKCAHEALTCPIDAPTVQLRPEIYVDHPRQAERYRRGTRLIEQILRQLAANPANPATQAALLRRLHGLGHIGYGVTLLPRFLRADHEVPRGRCRGSCGTQAVAPRGARAA